MSVIKSTIDVGDEKDKFIKYININFIPDIIKECDTIIKKYEEECQILNSSNNDFYDIFKFKPEFNLYVNNYSKPMKKLDIEVYINDDSNISFNIEDITFGSYIKINDYDDTKNVIQTFTMLKQR